MSSAAVRQNKEKMMDIEYKGGNSVVLSTKKASIVVDPNLSVVGLKNVSVKDAVELATEARLALSADDAKLVIEGPGEYGISDFDIRGVAAQRHLDTEADAKLSTMYRVESGDIRVAIIGNIYGKLSEDQLEALGIVDVAIVPIGGGGYTLDPIAAGELVAKIDPKVVIPVHYADDDVAYEVPQAGFDEFVKELGVPVEETSKYKIKSGSSFPATLTIIKLTRS